MCSLEYSKAWPGSWNQHVIDSMLLELNSFNLPNYRSPGCFLLTSPTLLHQAQAPCNVLPQLYNLYVSLTPKPWHELHCTAVLPERVSVFLIGCPAVTWHTHRHSSKHMNENTHRQKNEFDSRRNRRDKGDQDVEASTQMSTETQLRNTWWLTVTNKMSYSTLNLTAAELDSGDELQLQHKIKQTNNRQTQKFPKNKRVQIKTWPMWEFLGVDIDVT